MEDLLTRPWPWYVAGPLIGLFCPLLLLVGNRLLGFSANFRHVCAAAYPSRLGYFRYDWRREGGWNLALGLGVLAGGFVAGHLLANPEPVAISEATRADLAALGIATGPGLVPQELFGWGALRGAGTASVVVLGGLFVGFGTAYAGGCTSGHGLTGVASLQPASFLALAAFFAGGIAGTLLLLPVLLS
jgi:uncharacterized membrane protein YedE/YeeE